MYGKVPLVLAATGATAVSASPSVWLLVGGLTLVAGGLVVRALMQRLSLKSTTR